MITKAHTVRVMIATTLHLDGVLDEQALADLGMDSLDKLYLAVELETELGVEIDDEEIEGWFTVGDIVKTVERKV